jgi:SAM-dependent methyltransferase
VSSPASEAVSSPGPTLQLIAFNGTAGPASRSTNVNQADDLCRGLPSHGHIAAHRHSLGLSVFGVDQSAQMLATGRTRYPEVRFALSSITRLGPADGSCRGVLSRSSVIHLPPRLLPTALAEIAGVLAPGGWLLISFSATDAPEPPYEY